MKRQLTSTSEGELTIKQRRWIQKYLEYNNATKAAKEVYDCKDDNTAAVIGHENLRKLNFSDLMEEAGLTDGKLQQKLEEGLEAYKVDITGDRHSDYNARHKYLETALKLKKRLENKESQANSSVNITLRYDSGDNPTSGGRFTTPTSSVERPDEIQDISLAQES